MCPAGACRPHALVHETVCIRRTSLRTRRPSAPTGRGARRWGTSRNSAARQARRSRPRPAAAGRRPPPTRAAGRAPGTRSPWRAHPDRKYEGRFKRPHSTPSLLLFKRRSSDLQAPLRLGHARASGRLADVARAASGSYSSRTYDMVQPLCVRVRVERGSLPLQAGQLVLVFGGKGRAGACTNELAWMTTERMEWHAQARPRSCAGHGARGGQPVCGHAAARHR